MAIFGISVGRIIIGVCLLVIAALLIYWIVEVPEDRPIALLLLFEFIFFYFGLWKFLPWERSYVRSQGEKVATLRLGGGDRFLTLQTLLKPTIGNEAHASPIPEDNRILHSNAPPNETGHTDSTPFG